MAALSEAPYAFGSTLEKESPLPEENWRARLADPTRLRLVAEANGRVIGTVGGGPSEVGGVANLTSMWVHPSARGQGVGSALVAAVLEWAHESGFEQVFLWVAEGNSDAEHLYERHGFHRTGEVQEVRPGEPRVEYEMMRRL